MAVVLSRFSRYTDALLAGGIVSVIALLILPLPPELLAFLQVLNLGVAVTILLVAIYTREALDFSVFPSLLLVTTLFRLGLNISATRLILLQGGTSGAGPVIQAFGQFVVGGNFVVGIVVFLILTVIQFVVITNGAGRVAEVAARFTLDAMPGKQMAIDADLNAGLIAQDQAMQRRRKIQLEADFYGAMDGSSKFVKGDAIAGVVIILINIIGGIIIGVAQNSLDIGTALNQYTLLTIGDGLVTQIPALLISIATGIIVTRTDSGAANLGRDIVNQLLRNPRALATAGALIGIMGLVPGMPPLPFLGIGGAAIAGAWWMNRRGVTPITAEAREAAKQAESAAAKGEAQGDNVLNMLDVDPMELEVGFGLVSLVDKGAGANFLTRITLIRRQIAQELGIITPTIRIHDNLALSPNAYAIKLRGVVIAEGEVMPNHLLAMNPGTVTDPIDGIPTTEPTFGLPALWILPAQKERAELLRYTVVDPPSVVATHLTEVIKANAWALLSKRDVRQLLDHVKESNPGLVDDLIPSIVSVGEMQAVLQLLLRERVCIRDLPTIIEAVGNGARTSKDPDALAERARLALARSICAQYQGPDKTLHVITLLHEVELTLAHSVERTENGPILALEGGLMQRLLEGIGAAIERSALVGNQPALLVSSRVRMALRRLIERHLPAQPVLSYDEVALQSNVVSDGVVDVTARLPGGAAA
jgi:flagellar biosynthesis protein FlhA